MLMDYHIGYFVLLSLCVGVCCGCCLVVSGLQVEALVLQPVEQITSEIKITSDIKLVFNSSTISISLPAKPTHLSSHRGAPCNSPRPI